MSCDEATVAPPRSRPAVSASPGGLAVTVLPLALPSVEPMRRLLVTIVALAAIAACAGPDAADAEAAGAPLLPDLDQETPGQLQVAASGPAATGSGGSVSAPPSATSATGRS